MKLKLTCFAVSHLCMILILSCFCINLIEGKEKRWYIGRTPPSSFEYHKINGFYAPKQARNVCEMDLQCGGFTFKGSKRMKYITPEVYFFHYINESSSYLTTEIKYPHWTTYIVGSRDHIVVAGSYASHNSSGWRRWNRYRFSITLIFEFEPYKGGRNKTLNQCVNDLFRNSSVPDLTGDLNWETITALTESISDSVAIAIKGMTKNK